jgi:antitoxin VapB
MVTAKVFRSGNSQAVRLPKESRLSSAEVKIFRRGDELVLRSDRKRSRAPLRSLLHFPRTLCRSEGTTSPSQGAASDHTFLRSCLLIGQWLGGSPSCCGAWSCSRVIPPQCGLYRSGGEGSCALTRRGLFGLRLVHLSPPIPLEPTIRPAPDGTGAFMHLVGSRDA